METHDHSQDKLIVYKKEDGGMGCVAPCYKNRLENESEEDFYKRVAKTTIPRYAPWIVMDDPITLDRDFRQAWAWRGEQDPKLIIDLSEAKKIWVDKWRDARQPLLENLDVEYLKASESKDEKLKETIAQKKQKLRDVTKHDLSSVEDVVELKKVWPSTLEG